MLPHSSTTHSPISSPLGLLQVPEFLNTGGLLPNVIQCPGYLLILVPLKIRWEFTPPLQSLKLVILKRSPLYCGCWTGHFLYSLTKPHEVRHGLSSRSPYREPTYSKQRWDWLWRFDFQRSCTLEAVLLESILIHGNYYRKARSRLLKKKELPIVFCRKKVLLSQL